MTRTALSSLRLRLTAWYLGTFATILALLGIGLYVEIHRQFAAELDRSLHQATAALIRAANTRMVEQASARGIVVDAVDELRIPDRKLYLFDRSGALVKPTAAPTTIIAAAQRALVTGSERGASSRRSPRTSEGEGGFQSEDNSEVRYYAERFTLGDGTPMVAVASAGVVELQERYASLIIAFGAAALIALVLVAGGGWLLVRKSTVPIEHNMEQMRHFMADAAHELRTPVTVVRSRAEIALQQPREMDAYIATLQGIEAEGRRLGILVDDLLTLARADAGERPIERVRLFLDDLVLDAADAARVVANAKGVTLNIEEFEETAVEGDAALLRQLVMILLDNAVKFTPPGGQVVVRVGRIDGQQGLMVSDTGPGIPADQLPHVFERFYRGDAARTSHGGDGTSQGAGLGLAIAKWIAAAHGATISLASVLPAGTRATVLFGETRD